MNDHCKNNLIVSEEKFYQNFLKTIKKHEKLSFHKIQSRVDNQRTSVIKKIESLPIHHRHKETLIKLAINHKILDILKIIKSTGNTLTLHGKINLNRKEFSEITKSDNAVIKVKLDGDFHACDMNAYSKRNTYKNEEKKILENFRSTCFDSNQDFTCEKLVMLRERNVVIIQMINDAKTLKQMVEENPFKIGHIYKEILTLIWDLRNQYDSNIWNDQVDPTKKAVYFNQKWHIISSPDHYECTYKSHAAENISKLIEFFKVNGLSRTELERTFNDILKVSVCHHFYGIYCRIMEKNFKEPNDKKLTSPYYKKAFLKSTGKRMRSKKI